jgi:hypothetical protein
VVGNRVIAACNPSTLLCYSARDGKRLWLNKTDAFGIHSKDANEAEGHRRMWAGIVGRRADTRIQPDTARDYFLPANAETLPNPWPRGHSIGRRYPYWLEFGAWQYNLRERVGLAAGTPVSDGRHVYMLWENHHAAKYGLKDGRPKWMTFLGLPHTLGQSSNCPSPWLIEGKLICKQGFVLSAVDVARRPRRASGS